MHALSAPFRTFTIRLLVAVMALAMAVSPWAPLARPAAAAASPDLVIEAITTYPIDPVTGDAVTITVRVKNIGDVQAAASYVTCEADGVVLGSTPISQLVPGMTVTATFSWTAVPGAHIIKATADSTGIVAESDETNNANSYTIMPRAPDLTIDSITWDPENPELRQEVWFTVHIKNIGTTRSKATRVNFLVDHKSYGFQDVPALDPGKYKDIIYSWFAAPGQYLMTARVDEDGLVTEGDEENNEQSLTFTQSLADLFVTHIYQIPEFYSTGDSVTLTTEIKNQGNGLAGNFDVGYYINDEFLEIVPCAQIEAGTSANVSTTWIAKDGDNEVRVILDYYNVVPEINETNNEGTSELGTAPPDLTVTDISWTPTSIGVGDSVTLVFTITNKGEGNAAASRAICYIGLESAQVFPIPQIAAGKSYVLNVPWTAVSGTHDVILTANYDNGIYETKWSNNRRSVGIIVTPPDLIVSGITWEPEHPDHNTPVTFNVTLQNAGNGTATQAYLGYYIDEELVYNTIVKSLASGEKVTMQYTWTSERGYHTFKAMADFKKQVTEIDETNNELSVAIVANMPDLVIENVTWFPSDIPVGQDVTFTLRLRNTGSQPVPLTRLAYYVDDTMTGYVDMPPLEPDEEADRSLTWPVSFGQHVIRFVADSTDLVEEIDEENNVKLLTLPLPDLVVTDLLSSPAAPVIGETVTLIVTLKNEGESTTQATTLSGRLDENTAKLLPVEPIESGETVTKTFQWMAAGGTHSFSVTADITNTTIESDESNNYRSRKVITRTPELSIGDLDWSMPNPLVNDDVVLSAVIINTGDDTAPASTLVYRIDGGEPVTGEVPEIAAGADYKFTASVELQPTEHVFSLNIDTSDDVWENDETDNSANLTFNSKVPDLTIRMISWTPVEAAVGDNVTITVNLENRGTELVDGAEITMSINGEELATRTTGELGIGEGETLRFPWTVTTLQPVITIMADLGGRIIESDESNNQMTKAAVFKEPAPLPKKPSSVLQNLQAPPDPGFIQENWWMILAGAGVFALIIFVLLFRSFRKE